LPLTIKDVAEAVGAEVLCHPEALTREVNVCLASDLVSDILLCPDERAFLITGLANIQLVRAAEMIDLVGVLFVRGKQPPPDVVDFARGAGLPVLRTTRTMFESCGLLYGLGFKSSVYAPPRQAST
jgi:predicted transcriptional regulator